MRPDRQLLESELLVTRFQRGDQTAFDGIVRLWERSLFYYIRRLAPSEADTWDLLQETWLKVFRSMGSIRDRRTLPAFLYTTARNTAISRLRVREMSELEPDSAGASDSDSAFMAFDNAEQVHHALDQLPLPQREALTLFFLEELSIDEIAQVLEVPVGTVKSRLHYARKTMRQILSDGADHAG